MYLSNVLLLTFLVAICKPYLVLSGKCCKGWGYGGWNEVLFFNTGPKPEPEPSTKEVHHHHHTVEKVYVPVQEEKVVKVPVYVTEKHIVPIHHIKHVIVPIKKEKVQVEDKPVKIEKIIVHPRVETGDGKTVWNGNYNNYGNYGSYGNYGTYNYGTYGQPAPCNQKTHLQPVGWKYPTNAIPI